MLTLYGLVYYECVFFLAYFVDDIKCHFGASMLSGLVTTLASMPVDITKTRCVYNVTITGRGVIVTLCLLDIDYCMSFDDAMCVCIGCNS